MKIKIIYIILLGIILLPICSAAHYIVGYVENAKDGTNADGHSVLLWNPSIGIQDNLSDMIGPLGNSMVNNAYMFDCELLEGGCDIEYNLTLKIINNGDNYLSEEKNVTVSGFGYDVVENITLNSPPETNLIFPYNFMNFSYENIEFNCSIFDLDNNLKEVSLYGNWTGEWLLNETKEIGPGETFKTFIKTLTQGVYKYACKVTDTLLVSSFSPKNNSFIIDLTKPIVETVSGNLSYSCGKSNNIRINCSTYDELSGINNVIIQSISPSSQIMKYDALLLTGNTYYSDILLNETGEWYFNCISNDSAGNINNKTSELIPVYSEFPEISINFNNINLSKLNPIENENININAIVENLGCGYAENVLIGFFEGDPDNYGLPIQNITINISQNSYTQASIPWDAKIGPNNIFVFADYNFLINEIDEQDNKANKTISINAWQEIYGNTSVDKIIGGDSINIKKWFNESDLQGNIFITDSECSVNWLSLQAIGKSKSGGDSSNDFTEIDNLLGMTNFEDSISNLFSQNQIPKETKNMMIYQKEIQNIPIIDSTNNSNFVTGILWDFSDDTDGINGEYDEADKEDIIFVAEINKVSEGAYGIYDYEIKIPSKLREYNLNDSEEIYLYYNLD